MFFDHFGPMTVESRSDVDVRPRPHCGLATITYLFEGAMLHRDSLGTVQRIEPGAVNWMSAGRGIVHSERRPDDLRGKPYRLHRLQLWAALPINLEESGPTFAYTLADRLPPFIEQGVEVRVLVGSIFGRMSPAIAAAEPRYVDLRF